MCNWAISLTQAVIWARILQRSALYRSIFSREEIETFQCDRFNQIWEDAYKNIPFYGKWKTDHDLPGAIRSLSELSKWPVITKKEFQTSTGMLSRHGVKPAGQFLTGGSTGEPLAMGVWKDVEASPSIWIGKAAYGIRPGERTFHLWGHRHLYGYGVSRSLSICKQWLRDWLLNRFRYSAYDLSQKAMVDAFRRCELFKPVVFGGYSAAVLAYCRINRECGNKPSHEVKTVFSTAGTLNADERKEISEYFRAPICMEYGSADCAIMAYTVPETGKYRVFWDTHLLQGVKDENGEISNIVTRLTSCYIPMIRYNIGDYLELNFGESLTSILDIDSVKGRSSDVIRLPNGGAFCCTIIGDCAKQIPSVISSQMIATGDHLQIHVVALNKLLRADLDLIKTRFCTAVSSVSKEQIEVRQVDELVRTPAGKIPLVVRK